MIEKICLELGLKPIVSNDVILLAPLTDFWQNFKQSEEYTDGLDDPLDRYSKRVISPMAARLGVEAKFPSDGPPYPPFISWALAAEGVYLSPLGLLVHDEFGLFVSFRAALMIKDQAKREVVNPCDDCAKPCLTACPVGAFQSGEYDVETCKSHLHSGDVACWKGCLARRACPAMTIARNLEQSEFHMRAFAG